MVIIALAAVKGAASAYKRVRQSDKRNEVITPVPGARVAQAGGSASEDDAWESLSELPPDAAPEGAASARPFASARPSAFDGATSLGRLAAYAPAQKNSCTPASASSSAPASASAPAPEPSPAIVDLAAFAPEPRDKATASSGALLRAQSAHATHVPQAEPSRPQQQRKKAPVVDDGSFNHLRRTQSLAARAAVALPSKKGKESDTEDDEIVGDSLPWSAVGKVSEHKDVPSKASVTLTAQGGPSAGTKGGDAPRARSRGATAAGAAGGSPGDVLGSFNHALRSGLAPAPGKHPCGSAAGKQVHTSMIPSAKPQAPARQLGVTSAVVSGGSAATKPRAAAASKPRPGTGRPSSGPAPVPGSFNAAIANNQIPPSSKPPSRS